MFISQFRHLSSPRCTLQESLPNKKGSYTSSSVYQSPQCRSNESVHRPAFELVYNGTEQLVINLIQAIPVYLVLFPGKCPHQSGRFPSPVQP